MGCCALHWTQHICSPLPEPPHFGRLRIASCGVFPERSRRICRALNSHLSSTSLAQDETRDDNCPPLGGTVIRRLVPRETLRPRSGDTCPLRGRGRSIIVRPSQNRTLQSFQQPLNFLDSICDRNCLRVFFSARLHFETAVRQAAF